MPIPVQITFRGIPQSDSVESHILRHAEKLERFHDRITRCKVVVDAPHNRRHHGHVYSVHVDLRLPRSEIAASRSTEEDHSHEDLRVAIRDAFLAVEHQMAEQRTARERRRESRRSVTKA